MITAIGKLLGLISVAIEWFTGYSERKAGRQQQKLADTQAEVKTLSAERDAIATAGSAEDAARKGHF